MTIDWKRLSIGLFISIIIVCFVGVVLSALNVIQVDNGWYSTLSNLPTDRLNAISDCFSKNNVEITVASVGDGSNSILFPLWIWIMIGLFSIFGLATMYYFSFMIKDRR
jgi:hypothetical protein